MRSSEGDRKILTPHNNLQQQMAFFGFPEPFLDRRVAQPYRRSGRLILHEESWCFSHSATGHLHRNHKNGPFPLCLVGTMSRSTAWSIRGRGHSGRSRWRPTEHLRKVSHDRKVVVDLS
jgi:hypothetical protein